MSKQFKDKVGQNVRAGKEQTVVPYATWDFVSTTESKVKVRNLGGSLG